MLTYYKFDIYDNVAKFLQIFNFIYLVKSGGKLF